MKVKERDVVTLDDEISYAVISKVIYKGETFFCFANQDKSENFKILKLNENDGKLIRVTNQSLIKILLPLFLEDSVNILNCSIPDDDDEEDLF